MENRGEYEKHERLAAEASALGFLLLGKPPERQPLSDEAMKEWLNGELRREADAMADEWGLVPDAGLLDRLAVASSIAEKSVLQAEYLRAACDKFQARTQIATRRERKSTKWDSWPVTMRQTGEFNCAGATLLGDAVLRRAGIESILGRLPGHVVNVARLANGDYWYADLVSGPSQTRRIEVHEKSIDGKTMLSFSDPAIDYDLFFPQPNAEIGTLALGNLAHLQGVVMHGSEAGREEDRLAAEKIVSDNSEIFAANDFSELDRRLYGESPTHDVPEMIEQERRVASRRADSNLGASFVKTLGREQVTALVKEMLNRAADVGPYLRGEIDVSSVGFSSNLSNFLEVYNREFLERHGDDSSLRDITVNRMLARLKG